MLGTSELERSYYEDGRGNWTRRIRYTLDEALRREKAALASGSSAPFDLFDAWRENIDTAGLLNRLTLSDETQRWFSQVNVESWNPWQFHWQRHSASPYGHYKGARVADVSEGHPFPSHVKSAMLEYHRCKQTMEPTYFEIEQAVNGIYRAYTRLMIPLPRRRGKSRELIYAIRYTAEPSSLPV